jgi:hypothetical protein
MTNQPERPSRKRHEDASPGHAAADRREAQIAAYVDGQMASDEAAAFERQMETDEALCREVGEWRAALEAGRAWVDAEAPGVERMEALDVEALIDGGPREMRPTRVLTVRQHVWRIAAAAAIFAAGVLVGQLGRQGASAPAGHRVDVTPTPTRTFNQNTQPIEGDRPPKHEERRTVAQLETVQYTHDERGRLVVETTLKTSGGRASWVVDGNFDVVETRNW